MPASAPELVHGTAIALEGRAALIRGPSGAGKSDLALRCLMSPPGPLIPHCAELVADDQVQIELENGRLTARPPSAIRGLIEVRGIGIVDVPVVAAAELVLLVDLVPAALVDRLPDAWPRESLLGCALPRMALAPFEASAHLKLLLALHRLNSIFQIPS